MPPLMTGVPYLQRLSEVYRDIEDVYGQVAAHYGDFSCQGCSSNCCSTVFYHYTLIEALYFREGFRALPEHKMKGAIREARRYLADLARNPGRETALSIMCPVNFGGLCGVYQHRPLICRIHGVPAFLDSRGAGGVQRWKGCLRFQELYGGRIDHEIDRTPFYSAIAELEIELRKSAGDFSRCRKTIAHMIADIADDR